MADPRSERTFVRHWCLGVLPVLLVAALSEGSAASGRASFPTTSLVPAVVNFLDRYLAGDFDGAVAEATAPDDIDAILDGLKRDGPAWIDAAGGGEAPRRRLAAATFALEVARAAEHVDWKWVQEVRLNMGRENKLEAPDLLYWKAPPQLIEWGCTQLRGGRPAQEIERVWQLAALAVAQRRSDYEFLIGSPWDARGNPEDEITHLSHALERFPQEPRFVLARAIAIEWRTWSTARRRPRFGGIGLAEAIRAFEPLTRDDAIGAEASVRLGALQVRSRRFDAAADTLARVESATRDRYLLYLARYFTGQARDQQSRREDAERAFRGALEVIPGTTSATIALASLLARHDRRLEATELVEGSLGANQATVDPWRTYAAADDRFWPELIGRLRGEIRR